MTEKIPPVEEASEVSNEGIAEQRTTSVHFPKSEKYEIDPKTQEDIQNLTAEIQFRSGETGTTNETLGEIAYERNNTIEKYEAPVVAIQPRPRSKIRNVAMGFAALLGFGASTTAKAEMGNLNDSTKNKIEKVSSTLETKYNNNEVVKQKLCADWNDYHYWLKEQGLSGDESLDHNGKGMAILKKYIDEHPGAILTATPETVILVQTQLKMYRETLIKQLRDKKAQLTYKDPKTGEMKSRWVTKDENLDFFMKELSVVDGIPGKYTSKSFFAEAYLNTRQQETGKLLSTENLGYMTSIDKKIIQSRNPAGDTYAKGDWKNIPKNKK